MGKSAKQARINGIRKKLRSEEDCLIVFVTGRVFIILGRLILWFTDVLREMPIEVLENCRDWERERVCSGRN